MKKKVFTVLFLLTSINCGIFGQNTNERFVLRIGYLTSSHVRNAPAGGIILDSVYRAMKWEEINPLAFSTDVDHTRDRTETQVRTVLSQIGLTASEQNRIFSEFRNGARAIRYNYIDVNNYYRFIHIQRE